MPENVSVEIHHDFAVLEDRLAEYVGGLKARGGALAPVAIVAPTRRLITHLRVTLAERAGVLAAVRFFHHESLGRAIAAAAGVSLPRALGDGARAAIVAHLVAAGGGDLAAWMAARPRSAAALCATFDDLREAGVRGRGAGEAARGAAGSLSEGGRHTLGLYERYTALLDRLASSGFSDRAGRSAIALPHAAAFAARFEAIVHYGAYDLTGSNLDLLRGLAAAGRPLLCLAPGHREAPAFACARDFWRRHLGVDPVTIHPASATPARLAGARLPLLYDEEAHPAALPDGGAFAHAQGPAAEIGEAARVLLRDWRAGADGSGRRPAGMALIARSLAPYALHLGPVLGAQGIPFESSAALPAARQPPVQAALWLLRCLEEDFPAATLCDLLRTGLVRTPGADGRPGTGPPRPDAAERLMRDWQVIGGRVPIAERLPQWVEGGRPVLPDDAGPEERREAERAAADSAREARRLAGLVRLLARAGEPLDSARTWTAWAAACADLLRRHVHGYAATDTPSPGAGAVLETLADLGALDAAGVPLAPGAAAATFASALEEAALPIGSVDAHGTPLDGDGGGVRVLDAMQARGLAFDTVVLLGMNADLFPRRPREDPFLPDDDRRALRQAHGRPLPVAAEARDEEHLLLAHMLGAARRRLVILWQRADDDGRSRTPSLALREIARVLLGTPDLAAVDAAAARVSADPAARARAAVEGDAMIAPHEAGLAAAFVCRSPGALRQALAAGGAGVTSGGPAADGALSAGLALLEAIDGAATTPFDALVGAPGDPPPVWSPSRLETLGGCPQQYFFRHVLHVAEWEPPPGEHEIDARAMGALAHDVLRDLYAGVFPQAAGGRGGPDTGGEPVGPAGFAPPDAGRIRALLAQAWRGRSAALRARMRLRYPGLWDLLEAQWLEAIAAFAIPDIGALGDAIGPPRLEHPAEATIPLGRDRGELRLRGRFDRLLRRADGLVVADYKTGGRPATFVERASILKGLRVQIPLYVLLAERAAGVEPPPPVRAEVLGVGPAFSRADAGERSAALEPDSFAALREGFLETLAVLAELARAGLYPLDAEPVRCGRCPYTRACRRQHGPTIDRLMAHPALERFRGIREKSSRAPTLADVARRSAEAD